jgi:hypothetical protein
MIMNIDVLAKYCVCRYLCGMEGRLFKVQD